MGILKKDKSTFTKLLLSVLNLMRKDVRRVAFNDEIEVQIIPARTSNSQQDDKVKRSPSREGKAENGGTVIESSAYGTPKTTGIVVESATYGLPRTLRAATQTPTPKPAVSRVRAPGFSPSPERIKNNPLSFGFIVRNDNRIAAFDEVGCLMVNKGTKRISLGEVLNQEGLTLKGAVVKEVKQPGERNWTTNPAAVAYALQHENVLDLRLEVPGMRPVQIAGLQKECAVSHMFKEQLARENQQQEGGKRRGA